MCLRIIALLIGLSVLHPAPAIGRSGGFEDSNKIIKEALELFKSSALVKTDTTEFKSFEALEPHATLLNSICGFTGCSFQVLISQSFYADQQNARTESLLYVVSLTDYNTDRKLTRVQLEEKVLPASGNSEKK